MAVAIPELDEPFERGSSNPEICINSPISKLIRVGMPMGNILGKHNQETYSILYSDTVSKSRV
jgi:hypothetical protein